MGVYRIYNGFVLPVLSVRLSDEEVGMLNLLLKRGVYRSRNEAIGSILVERPEERLGEDEDVMSLVNKLLSLRKNMKPPIYFRSSRRFVKIVAEGRH